MTVKELYESFNTATDTLSSQIRYVNYSFIAVIWILSGQAVRGIVYNFTLLLPVLLSLTLDLLQYVWQSLVTWFFARGMEKKEQDGDQHRSDYLFPSYISSVSWVFFALKILSTIVAAVMLVMEVLLSCQ